MDKWEYGLLTSRLSSATGKVERSWDWSVFTPEGVEPSSSRGNGQPMSQIALLGLDGWELISVRDDVIHGDLYYFKRRVPR